MTAPKTHHLATIADILALTADEFGRMLPDLCTMHRIADSMREIDGVDFDSFDWIDDGQPGVKYVDFVDAATGDKTRQMLEGDGP